MHSGFRRRVAALPADPEPTRQSAAAEGHAQRRSVSTTTRTLDVQRTTNVSDSMIQGYRDKKTRDFAAGVFVRQFQGFAAQASRRLEILDAAMSLDDLRGLPSNRLEALRGDRAGQYSIRINDQWRICFEWPVEAGPSNVEIVDYH